MEAFEKLQQLGARKLPGTGVGRSMRECFVEGQPLFDCRETGKVVGGEHLAVPDRAVACYLLEPTGMDRGGDQHHIRLGLGQSVSGRRAARRGAVIDHPEAALGSAVGFLLHPVRAPGPKGSYARGGCTSSPHEPSSDLPRSQLWPGAPAVVLRLTAPHAARSGRQPRRAAAARLATGLCLGTDGVILGAKWGPLPVSGIPIQPSSRLLGQVGVAGQAPILVAPRFAGSGRQNPPDRAGPDRLAQRRPGLRRAVCGREPPQRHSGLRDRFTRHRFAPGLRQRGKTRSCGLAREQRSSRTPPAPSGASRTARHGEEGALLRQRGGWRGGERPARATPTGRVVAVDRPLSVAERGLKPALPSLRDREDDSVVRDLACCPLISLHKLASHTTPS